MWATGKPSGPPLGRGAGIDLDRRLLRQRVRHAAAVAVGTPVASTRPEHGRRGHAAALAAAPLDVSPKACSRSRSASSCRTGRPQPSPELIPTSASTSTASTASPARRGSSPTTAATSTRPPCPSIGRSGPRRFASSARRRSSTPPVIGQIASADGRHPGRPGEWIDEPLQAAADALDAGEVVAIIRRGRSTGPGLLRPRAQGALGCRPARADDLQSNSRRGPRGPCSTGRHDTDRRHREACEARRESVEAHRAQHASIRTSLTEPTVRIRVRPPYRLAKGSTRPSRSRRTSQADAYPCQGDRRSSCRRGRAQSGTHKS